MVKKTTKTSAKKSATPATKKGACPSCGKIHPTRKNIGISATQEEIDSLLMITNRINVATQAVQPSAISPGVTPAQVQIFVTAALEAKAEAMSLQRQWWKEILVKYARLPKDKNVFVDMETCEFYIMEQP